MKTTKYRMGHRWTTEEIRTLMKMWEAEDQPDVAAIAAALGSTESACYKMVVRLRREGIPLRRQRRGHVPGRTNRLWTQEEIEYLFRGRLAGRTVEEIAHDLDRTVGACQSMIQTLRKSGVPVAMLGQGVRRLWDPEAIKAATAGRFNTERVDLAASLDEGAVVQ